MATPKEEIQENLVTLGHQVERMGFAMGHPSASIEVLKMISETLGDSKVALDKIIEFKQKWDV